MLVSKPKADGTWLSLTISRKGIEGTKGALGAHWKKGLWNKGDHGLLEGQRRKKRLWKETSTNLDADVKPLMVSDLKSELNPKIDLNDRGLSTENVDLPLLMTWQFSIQRLLMPLKKANTKSEHKK
ncbi:MAG: hypothetical protein IPJ71_17780 [Bdellovibrionales bacterium]|nr:hypothetical protein [Bdellovibrionales bacterium]